ncbi:MAG: M28 family peptidase [Anaerolineales bacterium]|nr:M28 family peptidase [Anaerolineales bacterium]
MIYPSTHLRSLWRRISIFISLVVLLASSGMGWRPAQALTPDAPALLRLDLPDQQALSDLAGQGLNVYAQFQTPTGGVVLLLAVSPAQRDQLARRGYRSILLEREPSQDELYQLGGEPEKIEQAGQFARLLYIQDRQAVARLTPEQLERAAGLGLRCQLLTPLPLIAPLPDRMPNLPASITPDLFIQLMLDQVSADTLYHYVGDLSGEWPVTIAGEPYTIATRYSKSDVPIKKATRFAHDHLQSLGLPVDYHTYLLDGVEKRNVVADQTGLTQPERIFLLVAHLDSTSQSQFRMTLAPGADDNASGSAGLMMAADILTQYQFGCTIRYLLVTGEEQGMIGSYYYAQEAAARGDDIEAVLNLDMIAYDAIGAPTLELHTRYPGQSAPDLPIANLFTDVISAYGLDLDPEILQDYETFSDHKRFWDVGYPAILAIEDWEDFTPYYHTVNDRLSSLNMGYYTEFVKAALGTMAHMGCLLKGQLSGTVTNAATGDPIPGALVTAWYDPTHFVSATTLGDGAYQLPLLQGSYDVSASAPTYQGDNALGVQVLTSQVTEVDFSLQPCMIVRNVFFSFSPAAPGTGETVTFTASADGTQPLEYIWDFGDGSSGSGLVVTHSYATTGSYTVRLTVQNSCSSQDMYKAVPVGAFIAYLPFISHLAQLP